MKGKLKVKIWRRKNVVIAEIVEQDESLRSNGNLEIVRLNNNYLIKSCHTPAVDYDALYIRGDAKERDEALSACSFDTVQNAIDWCENITALINKINSKEKEDLEDDFIRVM